MTESAEDKLPVGPQVPYYVFFFPNIFESAAGLSIPENVSISEAERICKLLFRMDEPPSNSPAKCPSDISYIKRFIQARISTLAPTTPRQDFLALCLGMLVWLMEWMLQLKLTLLWSTGKKEIVCLIGASDQSYARMANIQQLRLRLKVDVDPQFDFMKVNPSTLLSRVLHPNRDLLHYTEDNEGKAEATSSIFSQLSRLSLLINHFENVIYFNAWANMGLITAHFALHDKKALERLYAEWHVTKLLDGNNVRHIRRYFGELVTLYFVWLGHLLLWLLVPAILGAGVWLLGSIDPLGHTSLYEQIIHIAFTVLIAIWAVLQGKFWLRREKDYSWRWAIYQNSRKETDLLFDSKERDWDLVTARMRKPRYEDKRAPKIAIVYVVTFAFSLLSLVTQAGIFSLSLWVEVAGKQYDLSGLVLGVQIYVFTKVSWVGRYMTR